MARSRNYQKSVFPLGTTLKSRTARNSRAHKKTNIAIIMKNIDDVDAVDIIFYDYKDYDNHWNYD